MTDLPAGVTDADIGVAISALHIAMSSFEKDVRVDELTLDEHDHLARVVFAALAGRVVVPREPTKDMIFQGSEAIENNHNTFDQGSFDDHVECAYRAMIAAAVDGGN
jgi:hypothetical protein